MSITSAHLESVPVATADDLFRMSVEDYHAAGRDGVLSHEDHVELLEGLVVRKVEYQPARSEVLIPADEAYYRFSMPQYHELVRLGIVADDDKVELLDGLLVKKMGKNPPHRIVKKLLLDILLKIVPPGWYVDDQEPITLDDSEPEPDLMVIRGDPRDHFPHPMPPAIGLAIEIAESSIVRDRSWKSSIYAAAGIPHYWIVNLVDRTIETYADPLGGDYRSPGVARSGEKVPLVLDGVVVGEVDVTAALTWSRS